MTETNMNFSWGHPREVEQAPGSPIKWEVTHGRQRKKGFATDISLALELALRMARRWANEEAKAEADCRDVIDRILGNNVLNFKEDDVG